jgi:hypothetical protein
MTLQLPKSGALAALSLSLFFCAKALGAPAPFNATSVTAAADLERDFRSAPAIARPWAFWSWVSLETSPEAVTKDLEEMHAKGIEGVMLFQVKVGAGKMNRANSKMELRGKEYVVVETKDFPDAQIIEAPFQSLAPWSPRQRELLRHVARESRRLGIKFALTVGLASTSGAIAPEYGQQKLMWSETAVLGPKDFDAVVPVPATDVPGGPKPSAHGRSRSPVHEVAVLAMPEKADVAAADVVNLLDKMDASGRLRWQVPAGKWTILRFGYTPTGAKNPWGLFTDGMSAEALDHTWDVTIGPLLREMSPDERQGLFGVVDDSWEAGITTWTKLFPTEFQQRRGYDLIPWLPALAGKNIGGAAAAENARRDYYRTIADLIAQNHYSHLRDLAHRNGLILFAEAAGPNSGQLDGMKNSGNVDVPMGEFWIPSVHRPTPAKRFLLRDSASAAHIYGKRVIACEAFTSIGPIWEESFFDLKNVADQAFCDGCNLIVIHSYSHSPSLTAKPGYNRFAGTHYNRNVTWWEQTPAFNAYLSRCSYLLQQGLFVADVLYYRGDAIGQIEQTKTRPALPAEGYDHDNCNLDVLLHRLKVVDGRLVLPDGMNYRVLVIPDGTSLRPEAVGRIAALEKDGATVVRGDSIVATLGVPPDFEYTGLSDAGELDWIHRRAGEVDIYFVTSRWDPKEKVACTFRVGGKQPELWDPVTGEIRDAMAFRQEDGRTSVPLEFNPRGSVFVVFRRPVTGNGPAASNYPTTQPLMEINGPWQVAFDPHWGGPATVTFDTLTDWTKRPEGGIRYYSGTAVYRNKFTLASVTGTLWLDLGEVREIATVKLNGVDLGVVWTRPGRVDISRAVRAGANDLEITIVNLWPNRLIGDAFLPSEKRRTETNLRKFSASSPLLPSGLLGPVRVLVRSP